VPIVSNAGGIYRRRPCIRGKILTFNDHLAGRAVIVGVGGDAPTKPLPAERRVGKSTMVVVPPGASRHWPDPGQRCRRGGGEVGLNFLHPVHHVLGCATHDGRRVHGHHRPEDGAIVTSIVSRLKRPVGVEPTAAVAAPWMRQHQVYSPRPRQVNR
jgi:hypothetical protein